MENYQNLVGKLLAGENLTIIQKRMDTAAFDIKTRTLYLPIWKDMTPEINDMLICHEVSHALFTPIDYVEALDTKLKFKNARSYLNILEDVRAEKLIKRKYPGIKKSFAIGYKQLNDKDFFEIKKKSLSECHLMDRINLFYKVGFNCGVTFNEAEKVFVDRAISTESIQDVINLAQDIFKFLKESKQKEKRTTPKVVPVEDLIGEPSDNDSDDSETQEGDSSEDSDESAETSSESEETDDSEDEDQAEGEGEGDSEDAADSDGGASRDESTSEADDEDFDDGEVTTESSFSEKSKELIDYSEDRVYLDLEESKVSKIVPFSLILESFEGDLHDHQNELIGTFKTNAMATVNYMVKEFEMKKAATAYKNNAIAKSGLLDVKKLYAYQVKEDLFKKISITKDGKNHGMVVLLDWSRSMRSCMRDATEQVITLAMFCKRVNIPFRVFAFFDGYCPKTWDEYYQGNYKRKEGVISSSDRSWALMELFSDQMRSADMKRMIDFLLSGRIHNICPLNGTPLTESLIYMYSYLNKFRKNNNAEKLSFITLTDGQGRCFGYYGRGYHDNETGKYIAKRAFIKAANKQMIEFDESAASQTSAILNAIRERYDCKSVGFYIGSSTVNEMNMFIRSNYGDDFYKNYTKIDAMKHLIKTECRKNDIAVIADCPGRDKLFYIPASKMKIIDQELVISDNDNTKKIAKEFSKHLTKKKVSRILLNEFVKIIA